MKKIIFGSLIAVLVAACTASGYLSVSITGDENVSATDYRNYYVAADTTATVNIQVNSSSTASVTCLDEDDSTCQWVTLSSGSTDGYGDVVMTISPNEGAERKCYLTIQTESGRSERFTFHQYAGTSSVNN